MTYKNKDNLGKRITAVCSCNEPVWMRRTNAADNSKNTFSKCFSHTHKQFFRMFTLHNWYVEVVSKIECLVFIHSTLYCVMHWANFCLFTIHVTEPSTLSALSSKNVCLGSSLVRVMGNWICTYGPEVTRAFTVIFSGTFLVKL